MIEMSTLQNISGYDAGSESDDDVFDIFDEDVRGVTRYVSDSEGFHHFSQVNRQAQPGDLIEIQRDVYSHYALYLGNGKVMNVDADDSTNVEARIHERTLEQVCDGSLARIRTHDDVARNHFQALPNSIPDIIRAAKSYEFKLIPYQFGFRNSEYYCTLWRFGIGFSTQTAEPASTQVAWCVGEVGSVSPYVDLFKRTTNSEGGDGYDKYRQLAFLE